MEQLSNKEYEKYQQHLTGRLHGGTLTPDGLRIICAGFDYDPDTKRHPDTGDSGSRMPFFITFSLASGQEVHHT